MASLPASELASESALTGKGVKAKSAQAVPIIITAAISAERLLFLAMFTDSASGLTGLAAMFKFCISFTLSGELLDYSPIDARCARALNRAG